VRSREYNSVTVTTTDDVIDVYGKRLVNNANLIRLHALMTLIRMSNLATLLMILLLE
jgi:hypothetical protein